MEPRSGRDQPPFLGADAVAEGATTGDRLGRGDFVQLAANVYAGADTADDVARGVDCAWDDAELILPTPRARPRRVCGSGRPSWPTERSPSASGCPSRRRCARGSTSPGARR